MFKQSVLVAALCVTSFGAQAWDVPKLPGSTGGDKTASQSSGDVEKEVTDFTGKSDELATMATTSLVAINGAFTSEVEAAKYKADLEGIMANTNPKERGAAMAKMNETQSAIAATNGKASDIGDKVKLLSADKKKQISTALFNFGIAALKAPSLISKGQSIISATSLTNMAKVLPVKDALPLLGRFVSDGSSTIAGFIKIAKGANISVPAVTSSSSYEKVNKI